MKNCYRASCKLHCSSMSFIDNAKLRNSETCFIRLHTIQYDVVRFNTIKFSFLLWFAKILPDEPHSLRFVVLGVFMLVAFFQLATQLRTALDPAVQMVQGYMWAAFRKVHQSQL